MDTSLSNIVNKVESVFDIAHATNQNYWESSSGCYKYALNDYSLCDDTLNEIYFMGEEESDLLQDMISDDIYAFCKLHEMKSKLSIQGNRSSRYGVLIPLSSYNSESYLGCTINSFVQPRLTYSASKKMKYKKIETSCFNFGGGKYDAD